GSGALWGFRAGYAAPLSGRLFGAVELEFVQPHAAAVTLDFLGNRYRTALENEGAAYLRLGWRPRERTALFVRAGLAVPQQVTTLNGTTTRRLTPTPGFGLGAEQALGAGIALRADVTWLPAVENNRISSLRGTIGLTYGF
nr:hypothetical protein [Rubritepida sp.]